MFDFFVVVFLLFFVQKHIFVTTFCNIFCYVNVFSIVNILRDLWQNIRVTDLASLSLLKISEM